jgi:hypothetical protein
LVKFKYFDLGSDGEVGLPADQLRPVLIGLLFEVRMDGANVVPEKLRLPARQHLEPILKKTPLEQEPILRARITTPRVAYLV